MTWKNLSFQLHLYSVCCLLLKSRSYFHEVTIIPQPSTSPTSQPHSFTKALFLERSATQLRLYSVSAFLLFLLFQDFYPWLLKFQLLYTTNEEEILLWSVHAFTYFAQTSYINCENTEKYTGRRKAEGTRITGRVWWSHLVSILTTELTISHPKYWCGTGFIRINMESMQLCCGS